MAPRKHNSNFLLLFLFLALAAPESKAQAPAEDFKPSGKVWGYAFGDFYIKASGDTATWGSKAEYSPVPKEVYAFAFRRMYLGYDYTISPRFSTQVILEGQDAYQDVKGNRTVTIKSLHVRWKNIYKRADLLIGQISTLSFATVLEKVWNYRSIEKTIVDQRGIRSSSDMGVSLNGLLDSLGRYGYNLMIGNGSGTKPEELTAAGKHKIYSAELYGYFFDKKILLDLYGDIQTGLKDKNQLILRECVAYQAKSVTIGAEVINQTLSKNKSDGTNTRPFGFSIFSRGVLIKDQLGFFARYDTFNQDLDYRDQDIPSAYSVANMYKHYDEQFFLAGLDFTPHKNVHLMPNIWINTYSAKRVSSILPDRKADVVPRLTFMFVYR